MCHLKNAQCGKRVPADRRTKLATVENLDQSQKSGSTGSNPRYRQKVLERAGPMVEPGPNSHDAGS
jgi:hypothetical protein